MRLRFKLCDAFFSSYSINKFSHTSQGVGRLFALLFVALNLFSGVAMSSPSDSGLTAGHWRLDGAFTSSGEAMMVTIVEQPQKQWHLILPKDLQPSGGNADVPLRQTSAGEYSASLADGVKLDLTLTSPGKAQMVINTQNNKGFSRFGYSMSLMRN